uniref:SAC domain-containing protein n=1 Tax=Macrostomum lignano TaxID=282301 RepID=A0A1I8F8I6_9PLAT
TGAHRSEVQAAYLTRAGWPSSRSSWATQPGSCAMLSVVRDSDQLQRAMTTAAVRGLKLRADLLYFSRRGTTCAGADSLTPLLDECSTDDQFMAAYNLLLDIFLQPDIAAQHSDSHRLALQNCLLLNPLCDRLWRRTVAGHITTVLAVQESNLKLQISHGSAGSDQRTPIAGKAMSLISFHGNYRNLPYSGRLWERLSYKQANAGFDRKRIDCGGNEALFDSIYFSDLSQPRCLTSAIKLCWFLKIATVGLPQNIQVSKNSNCRLPQNPGF